MKVVLGYSGGLDTSVIVPWLRENYGAEVVCMAGDVGQQGGLEGLEARALATGATAFYGEDLRQEFVEDYVWPTLKIGAVYGRKYLLGTAIARPLLAKRQVDIAKLVGADALAHGCTGKGNDQVRFELTYAALAPDLKVVATWREWDIRSREDALEYAHARDIPLEGVDQSKLYSRDENLWHISHEGGPLEDPGYEPEEAMFLLSQSPEAAPDVPAELVIAFENGRATSIDGESLSPVALLTKLNKLEVSPELIITDVVMPGMGGSALVEKLKERFPEAAFLYMSGYADDILTTRGFHSKEVNFLAKPFSPRRLALHIHELLMQQRGRAY